MTTDEVLIYPAKRAPTADLTVPELSFCLLRAAGSARGGGTVVRGQGYMKNMLWACLSV